MISTVSQVYVLLLVRSILNVNFIAHRDASVLINRHSLFSLFLTYLLFYDFLFSLNPPLYIQTIKYDPWYFEDFLAWRYCIERSIKHIRSSVKPSLPSPFTSQFYTLYSRLCILTLSVSFTSYFYPIRFCFIFPTNK